MDDQTERAARIKVLAETVLKASQAMESEDWPACQRLFQEAARQSRVLALLQKQSLAEGSD